MDGSGLRAGGQFLLVIGAIVAFVTLTGISGFRLEAHETILLVMNVAGAWLIAGVVALVGGTIVDAVVANQNGQDQSTTPAE